MVRQYSQKLEFSTSSSKKSVIFLSCSLSLIHIFLFNAAIGQRCD